MTGDKKTIKSTDSSYYWWMKSSYVDNNKTVSRYFVPMSSDGSMEVPDVFCKRFDLKPQIYDMDTYLGDDWITPTSHIFPNTHFFGDTDKTVVICCKSLVAFKRYTFSTIVTEVIDQYVQVLFDEKYKLSKWDWYNEEIKKGILTYLSNTFEEYVTANNEDVNEKIFDYLLFLIRNLPDDSALNISAKKLDYYVQEANKRDSVQAVADLMAFKHKHHGNPVDEKRFNL